MCGSEPSQCGGPARSLQWECISVESQCVVSSGQDPVSPRSPHLSGSRYARSLPPHCCHGLHSQGHSLLFVCVYLVVNLNCVLLEVWDMRTYQPLHTYKMPRPAVSMDISGRGLLAVGRGRQVSIWRDAISQKQLSPYLTHGSVLTTPRVSVMYMYESMQSKGRDLLSSVLSV